MSGVRFDIDDSNFKLIVEDSKKLGFGFGWNGSANKPAEGFGGNPTRWDNSLTMSIREITEEARRIQETGWQVRGYVENAGWDVLHQEQTNHCWSFGPTAGAEFCMLQESGFYVPLSATSVACRVNGFRNQGGWGTEAVKFAASPDGGFVPLSLWPNGNAGISRRWLTNQAEEAGRLLRVEEYFDLPRNSFEVLATCVLRLRRAVAVGLDWWGHEVLVVGIEVDSRGNLWGVGVNSWGTGWGDRGWFRLSRSRLVASDQVCIRSMSGVSEDAFRKYARGSRAVRVAA